MKQFLIIFGAIAGAVVCLLLSGPFGLLFVSLTAWLVWRHKDKEIEKIKKAAGIVEDDAGKDA